MEIVTNRLILHPLTPREARRIVDRTPAPDERWHDEYPLEDELVPLRALAVASEPDPVFTLYVIRTSEDAVAVGGIGFFGPPDNEGVVEIGYGLVKAVRCNGLATEALIAAAQHAISNGARIVKADTDLDNLASQRVLAKAGFAEVSRSTTLISYRLA